MTNDDDAAENAAYAQRLESVAESVRAKLESARLMDELQKLLMRVTQADPATNDWKAEMGTIVRFRRAAVLSAANELTRLENDINKQP